MNDSTPSTYEFRRSHEILIAATPAEVLDYVSNPNTWPEWIAASHEIDSPDRPLVKGDHFREEWATRTGPAELKWTVTDSAPGRFWVGETGTPFLGPIIVRYDVVAEASGTRFTRSLHNPARPKPATEAMIAAIDDEAAVSLENIKRNVERRTAD